MVTSIFCCFDKLVILFTPNYAMLLRTIHIKHWFEMASVA